MKNVHLLLIAFFWYHSLSAQSPVVVKESTKTIKTYPFNDPNPIPSKSLIYPYYRYDGFTDKPVDKPWKVVELENEYIKVMIMPEIGGKIWTAWEKSTGLPFIYNNQVVKFRDVAMRGPWTSGGIEPNYGIIGHTPNCATPVDYKTEHKADGSVSCYVGTFDKLTQTYWTLEINLAPDKAYFTTRSTWHNANYLEQPYYTWMNVGMPSKGNLEFIFPGTRYIGHEGEYASWKINEENKKDISFYEQNNFGSYKSYHVFGSYTDFFASFYHDQNFGMGHYSRYDEKPGKKIWIWGLSRQGMIWENLLTDKDGQYVEVQSGRLFNQSADNSLYTPFKHRGFAPYATDEWTEYWFPIKGTNGVVKADPSGSLNLKQEGGYVKWFFSPLQSIHDKFILHHRGEKIAERNISVKPLQVYRDSLRWTGNLDELSVTIGDTFFYDANPTADHLSRPVALPAGYNWETPYALYTLGKGAMQTRDYAKAESKFQECLSKDPFFLPALTELSFLQIRKMEYEKARESAMKALSINTYDPGANFAYGVSSVATYHLADAKDAFGIASASNEYRSAAYTELAKLYYRQNEWKNSLDYAHKAVQDQPGNINAWQIIALIHRSNNEKEKAVNALNRITELNPLSHFANAEKMFWKMSSAQDFTRQIHQEMSDEIFISLADWYQDLNRLPEAIELLKLVPNQAEALYWQAYLLKKNNDAAAANVLKQADQASPALIFPYRTSAAQVMEWAMENTSSWKPKYFLALVHWNAGNTEKARSLLQQCGEPDFVPFYAAKAALFPAEEESLLTKAMQLDKNEWRYGKLLINHYLNKGERQKALTLAIDYQKRFPNNDGLSFLLARCYLLNKQYANSLQVLTGKTFLPNEGATEGRQLYRESLLMMAFDNLEKGKYAQAMANIEKARQWPESLGVGKPYDAEIDERFEKFMQALCLDKMKKKSEADKLYTALTTEKIDLQNAYLLINAYAHEKRGSVENGNKLLAAWKEKTPDQSSADWCLKVYQHKSVTETIPSDTDQFRLLSRLSGYMGAKN